MTGPIEKGANDGQVQYAKDIFAAVKAAGSARSRTNTGATTNGNGKHKKKGKKEKGSKTSAQSVSATVSKPTESNWGLLEPLHGPLGPIVDMVQPLLSGNVIIGLVITLLLFSWFRSGGSGSGKNDMGFYGTPERIAAYEEIWRREESELWDWLEERVGLERLHAGKGPSPRGIQEKVIEERLKSEGAGEKEIENAIRVTEEKLLTLKASIERKKNTGKSDSVEDVD